MVGASPIWVKIGEFTRPERRFFYFALLAGWGFGHAAWK